MLYIPLHLCKILMRKQLILDLHINPKTKTVMKRVRETLCLCGIYSCGYNLQDALFGFFRKRRFSRCSVVAIGNENIFHIIIYIF